MVVDTGHASRKVRQALCFMAGNIQCSKTLVLIGPRGVLCANERYLSICARLLFLYAPTTRMSVSITESEWALCTAALLPELQPAPCFLSAISGQN